MNDINDPSRPADGAEADKIEKKQKQRTNRSSLFFLCLIFFALIAADQAVKHFAGRIFFNAAFAFSLPLAAPLMFTIYFVVLLSIIIYVAKNYQRFSIGQAAAWLLIFAGALSNIGERIYFGYVRDFIYISLFKWTGIYNLADGYIVVGIVILILQSKNRN